MNVPALITYPARPIQGGRLELAPPKRGLWYAEPKFNGWRALIHTPTGTMWNRHGALLTIVDCFRPALAALAKLAGRGFVWADCEALERRHNLGRGTLVVLDVVPESGTPSYEERREMLESLVATDALFSGDTSCAVPCGAPPIACPLGSRSESIAGDAKRRSLSASRLLQECPRANLTADLGNPAR